MSAASVASAINAHAASSAFMPSPLRTFRIGCCIPISLPPVAASPPAVPGRMTPALGDLRARSPERTAPNGCSVDPMNVSPSRRQTACSRRPAASHSSPHDVPPHPDPDPSRITANSATSVSPHVAPESRVVPPWTPMRHRARSARRSLLRGLYGARMARLNLRLSDDLYEIIVREATKAGVTPAAWARESLAWRAGRLEAASVEERVAALEAELARLRGDQ